MGKDYVRKELEDKLDELSAIEKNGIERVNKITGIGKIYAKEEEKLLSICWEEG